MDGLREMINEKKPPFEFFFKKKKKKKKKKKNKRTYRECYFIYISLVQREEREKSVVDTAKWYGKKKKLKGASDSDHTDEGRRLEISNYSSPSRYSLIPI